MPEQGEVYDIIGQSYSAFRNADARIVAAIHDLLALPARSRVADVGAGTGNYTNALSRRGYRMIAVEPSETMRMQAASDADVKWLAGSAESIPLADASVDGVIATLAIHHFSDLRRAAAEMRRICPGSPSVIFTLDPRRSEYCWFGDYFPGIQRRMFRTFPAVDELVRIFAAARRSRAVVRSFPLPADLTDLNMHAGWNRPEIYLNETIRRGMSGFALAAREEIEAGLARLDADLRSGMWDKRHGAERSRKSADLGFVLLRFGN